MTRNDGAEWSEDDHDGNADYEITPSVLFNTSISHNLSPIKALKQCFVENGSKI